MNAHQLCVYHLPSDVADRDLADSAAIVIDLLRASTTICQALASGAREVVPFLEIDDVMAALRDQDRSQIVLGGERSGGKIKDFDLGNSPSDYTPDAVRGRRVFITTTNGTRALHHARLARRILVGCVANISAVAASIQDERRVNILCAGTGREETREDILAAGAFVTWLEQQWDRPPEMNDQAVAACGEWQKVLAAAGAANRSISEQFAMELRDTQGGRNLLGIGLDRDLVDCAQVDRLDIVPELDVREWRITSRRS